MSHLWPNMVVISTITLFLSHRYDSIGIDRVCIEECSCIVTDSIHLTADFSNLLCAFKPILTPDFVAELVKGHWIPCLNDCRTLTVPTINTQGRRIPRSFFIEESEWHPDAAKIIQLLLDKADIRNTRMTRLKIVPVKETMATEETCTLLEFFKMLLNENPPPLSSEKSREKNDRKLSQEIVPTPAMGPSMMVWTISSEILRIAPPKDSLASKSNLHVLPDFKRFSKAQPRRKTPFVIDMKAPWTIPAVLNSMSSKIAGSSSSPSVAPPLQQTAAEPCTKKFRSSLFNSLS